MPNLPRLRLIDDWHRCWRWSSVWFMAIAAAAQTALMIPGLVLQYAPQWLLQTLATLAIVGAFLGRITKMEEHHDLEPPQSPQ